MQIGNVQINSKLALAPMAGVTDAAFRQICSELGAGYTVTELVSAKALCYQGEKSRLLLKPFPGEHPTAAQIFGSEESSIQWRSSRRRLPEKSAQGEVSEDTSPFCCHGIDLTPQARRCAP